MPLFPMTIDIKINDKIPAKAKVRDYRKFKGNYSPVALDPEEYFGRVELDYEIRDKKGNPAPKIESFIDKMNLRDEVEQDIMEMVDSAREALKEDRMKARRKGEI